MGREKRGPQFSPLGCFVFEVLWFLRAPNIGGHRNWFLLDHVISSGNKYFSFRNAFYLVFGGDVIFRAASRKSETTFVKQNWKFVLK